MLWFADGDDDGYGAGAAVTSCEEPSMHAGVAGDCDDADARRHPGAAETCDTFDQDCDGLADEGAPCRSGCEVRHRDTRPYLFCDTPDRHRDAITACPTGYELTTIDDAIEDAWVASNARGIRATGWWIGYYDADEDGVYAWVSGTSAYTGWGPREPSGGTEHCALIAWYGTGANSWNDGDCDFDFPFVCESLR